MTAVFESQPPSLISGALLGGCVVLMYLVANLRLGVVGGFSDVVERASARSVRLGTRGTFLVGIVIGGLLFVLVSGGYPLLEGYGWVTREFSDRTAAVVLFGAGALIGFGAKTAGGCTSGNGLCGNASGSPASMVATATFFGTAVAVALLTAALFGGSA
jgi:hypothetical protein